MAPASTSATRRSMCRWGRVAGSARGATAPTGRKKPRSRRGEPARHSGAAGAAAFRYWRSRLRYASSVSDVSIGRVEAEGQIWRSMSSLPRMSRVFSRSLDFILRRAGWSIAVGHRRRCRCSAAVRRGLPQGAGARRHAAPAVGLRRAEADARRRRAARQLPVLILTAKGQAQDRRIAEELGADRVRHQALCQCRCGRRGAAN